MLNFQGVIFQGVALFLVPRGLGLANGPNGLVLRADRSKEPVEFTSLGDGQRNGHGDGDETVFVGKS